MSKVSKEASNIEIPDSCVTPLTKWKCDSHEEYGYYDAENNEDKAVNFFPTTLNHLNLSPIKDFDKDEDEEDDDDDEDDDEDDDDDEKDENSLNQNNSHPLIENHIQESENKSNVQSCEGSTESKMSSTTSNGNIANGRVAHYHTTVF